MRHGSALTRPGGSGDSPELSPGTRRGADGIERLREVGIEVLIRPEVEVLEPAGSVLHALAADDRVPLRIEICPVAREQDPPRLPPRPREGGAVPVIHEAAVQGV